MLCTYVLKKYYYSFEQVIEEIKAVINDEDQFTKYEIEEAYRGFQRLN
jgi:hypothetical protein